MSDEGSSGRVSSNGATNSRVLGRGPATARFLRQHDELAALAKDLVKALDTRTLSVDPTAVRRMLAVFSGRLRVHATMEREALYPRLLASADAEVAAKANELLAEIGDLYDVFFSHLGRWSDAASIKADPESFCRETMQLLFRLGQRMKRENEELYPLVDRLEPVAASGEHEAARLPAEGRKREA